MRVLALIALAFVGLCPAPADADSVKVGAVVPLTGRYGAGGAQVRAGDEIAVAGSSPTTTSATTRPTRSAPTGPSTRS